MKQDNQPYNNKYSKRIYVQIKSELKGAIRRNTVSTYVHRYHSFSKRLRYSYSHYETQKTDTATGGSAASRHGLKKAVLVSQRTIYNGQITHSQNAATRQQIISCAVQQQCRLFRSHRSPVKIIMRQNQPHWRSQTLLTSQETS